MQSRHQELRRRTSSTSPPAEYQFHCFLSYTTREEEVSEIKPYVDKLADRLKETGVVVCPVFYDGWYLQRRKYKKGELEGKLTVAIAGSAFTICFVSPGYIDSLWCQFEWNQTESIHSHRGAPAMEHSILPVLWKTLPAVYFRREKRVLRRKLLDRLNWRGLEGIVPPKARAIDFTGSVDLRSGGRTNVGTWQLLLAIQEYLERWYPDKDWHDLSGERL